MAVHDGAWKAFSPRKLSSACIAVVAVAHNHCIKVLLRQRRSSSLHQHAMSRGVLGMGSCFQLASQALQHQFHCFSLSHRYSLGPVDLPSQQTYLPSSKLGSKALPGMMQKQVNEESLKLLHIARTATSCL